MQQGNLDWEHMAHLVFSCPRHQGVVSQTPQELPPADALPGGNIRASRSRA